MMHLHDDDHVHWQRIMQHEDGVPTAERLFSRTTVLLIFYTLSWRSSVHRNKQTKKVFVLLFPSSWAPLVPTDSLQKHPPGGQRENTKRGTKSNDCALRSALPAKIPCECSRWWRIDGSQAASQPVTPADSTNWPRKALSLAAGRRPLRRWQRGWTTRTILSSTHWTDGWTDRQTDGKVHPPADWHSSVFLQELQNNRFLIKSFFYIYTMEKKENWTWC